MNDQASRIRPPALSAAFAANLAALKDWAPSLHDQLSRFGQPHAELVVDPDGGVDLAFAGQRFYEGDALAGAEKQVADFFAKPLRNFLNEPDPEALKGGIGDFCQRMTRRMAEAGLGYDPKHAPEESHFMVVLGIGLGLHVAPLLARSRCRSLVLVEPTLENLYHSLHVTDWRGLFEDAADRSVEITFVIDRNPTTIMHKVMAAIRSSNPALFDGLYIFTHYNSAILNQARDRLQRDLYAVIRGLGFFEDEVEMTTNAVKNFARPEAMILDRSLPVRDEALFIVGSGPSLDAELEVLKAWAGRVAIMSVGTTLRILLANGIRPDFHIELENGDNTAKVVTATAAEFDTSGITLIAAVTVRPQVADPFERTAFFFREENSATALIGGRVAALSPSGPTVANAGLSAAFRLGFREIYLFGVDMGSKEEGRYHADGSVFSEGLIPEYRHANKRFPGNFGGEVSGEAVLNWSRHFLEAVLRTQPNVTVYNCSDGVRIDGAIPKVSRAIELTQRSVDRDDLAAAIDEAWAGMSAARMAEMSLANLAAARTGRLFDDLRAALDAAVTREGEVDPEWIHEVFALLRPQGEGDGLVCNYLRGSLLLIMGCGVWYGRRVAGAKQLGAVRRIALEETVAALEDYRRRLTTVFDDAENCLAGAPSAD